MSGTTCLPEPTRRESRFQRRCGNAYTMPSTSKKYSVKKYDATKLKMATHHTNLNQYVSYHGARVGHSASGTATLGAAMRAATARLPESPAPTCHGDDTHSTKSSGHTGLYARNHFSAHALSALAENTRQVLLLSLWLALSSFGAGGDGDDAVLLLAPPDAGRRRSLIIDDMQHSWLGMVRS